MKKEGFRLFTLNEKPFIITMENNITQDKKIIGDLKGFICEINKDSNNIYIKIPFANSQDVDKIINSCFEVII